jgi:hypothetical protein
MIAKPHSFLFFLIIIIIIIIILRNFSASLIFHLHGQIKHDSCSFARSSLMEKIHGILIPSSFYSNSLQKSGDESVQIHQPFHLHTTSTIQLFLFYFNP